MDLNKVTGRVLRYGVYIAVSVIAIGVVISQFGGSVGGPIVNAGIALLVLTPFFSIVASTVALYTERDYRWMRVALCVLGITFVGIAVAFFF